MLRPGGLSRSDIEHALGRQLAERAEQDPMAPMAPGQLVSHYAPHARLRLDAQRVASGEALLAFGAPLAAADRAAHMLNLSPRGDLIEAAANLFAHLRALDAANPSMIAVMPIPLTGLGEAINDRLKRAAAPQS
jgi:L-threonylcarbamoyladenylate synthase